jgi:hypothetical protein
LATLRVAREVGSLESRLRAFSGTVLESEARGVADQCREVLRAYRQAIQDHTNGPELSRLRELAREALLHLGGDGERSGGSLKHYDHLRHGPFLGVSDEGSAAEVIRSAAQRSPKARALGEGAGPLALGMGHDAERLGAVGEVPVGPDEHAAIWLACVDRLLVTTNIGTRASVRHYRRYPLVEIPGGDVDAAIEEAGAALEKELAPFLHAAGGPRPLTVYVELAPTARRTVRQQRQILRALLALVTSGKIADPHVHRLGLSVRIGWGPRGRDEATRAIDLVADAGLAALALDGVVRKDADQNALPGLLNYLAPGLAGPVLRHAQERGVEVRTRNNVDADTVARLAWSVLNTARGFGLHLGKYGTFPLTLEETDRVVELVQRWFSSWSAAPVLFVDQPVLGQARVYADGDRAKGVEAWLRVVARHRVPVVLIDTVDKASGWRLFQRGRDDRKGLLGPRQIRRLDELARGLGIKVLWAGGLTMADAYALGHERVFGVYITSAAARATPVPVEYEKDPLLASVKEPSLDGVARTKSLLEAGFLRATLGGEAGERIDAAARALLAALESDEARQAAAAARLDEELLESWRVHLGQGGEG